MLCPTKRLSSATMASLSVTIVSSTAQPSAAGSGSAPVLGRDPASDQLDHRAVAPGQPHRLGRRDAVPGAGQLLARLQRQRERAVGSDDSDRGKGRILEAAHIADAVEDEGYGHPGRRLPDESVGTRVQILKDRRAGTVVAAGPGGV